MENVGVVFIISLMTVGLISFIQKCFQENMIFRRYYLMLVYYWIKWRRKKDRWKRKFLKPLGLCIYCQIPWISIPIYFYFYKNIILFFLFIGLNYIIIEILFKLKILK
jgi:hypothetical protein